MSERRCAWAGILVLLALALGLLLPGVARAQAAPVVVVDPDDPTLNPTPRERRNGVVLGVTFGAGFAGASGTPNNVRLYDNPAFYSQSPLLAGTSTTYFLMGALSDSVNFGPMVNVATFENDRWRSTGFGIGFRGELFPFGHWVRALADTAIYGQVGVGSTELQAKGPYPSADGSQSFFGIGAHHEFRLFKLLGGHFAFGPHLEYDVIRSDPAERHWLTLGLRLVWYGGHVALDDPARPRALSPHRAAPF